MLIGMIEGVTRIIGKSQGYLGLPLRDEVITCRKCGRLESDTSQLVADHIVAHRGNADLFWLPSNIRCLCKPCHDRVKQAEERIGYA